MEYILMLIILILIIALIVEHRGKINYKNKFTTNTKHWESYVIMKKWMENRNQNKLLKDYFSTYPYKKVAIYGAGDLGKMLAYELKDSNIKVSYYIDRMAESLKNIEGIPVIDVKDFEKYEKVDAIIITPLIDYNSVNEALVRKGINVATVSLRDIIYEV